MQDINDLVLTRIADVCQIMGDSNRMRILFLCAQKPVAVNSLVENLGLSQPLVSHHLKLMKQQRLVKGERQGKQVLYSLHDEHIHCILKDMYQHWTDESH